MTVEVDWADEKYTLVALYGVLMVIAGVQVLRIIRAQRRDGIFFIMRVRLQFILFCAILARFVMMAIPVSFYNSLTMKDVWLQVCMDLLPEVLFWLAYVLLVVLWAAMYYGSFNANRDRLLHMSFIGIVVATFVSMFIVAGVMQAKQIYNLRIEAIYLFVLAMCTVISFALYGSLLYTRARAINVNAKHKDTMLQKLKWIAVIVCACDIAHCVFLVITDFISAKHHRPSWFIYVWFVYLLTTEFMPASIILYIFRKVPENSGYAPVKDTPPRQMI